MILVDTGPLVAIFDPKDAEHADCTARLDKISGPTATTLPVLTETFYMLGPTSRGASNLRAVLSNGSLSLHLPAPEELRRAFALMDDYRDLPMDFADASLIAAAETLKTLKVFTLDARDFSVYRIKRGHRRHPVNLV